MSAPPSETVSVESPAATPPTRGRRAWRVAFASLSAISLTLCAVSVALWVRGYSTADTVMWRTGHPVERDWHRMDYMARSLHGRLVFWRTGRVMGQGELGDDPAAAQAKLQNEQTVHHWANEIRVFRRAWPEPVDGVAGTVGFRWQQPIGGSSGRVGIPMWLFVTVTSVIPLLRTRVWIRKRRRGAETPETEIEGALPA
jgi:hypothetical protein